MKVTKPYNLTLLNVIAEAKEITYEELKTKYLPPEQPWVIQEVTVMFDSDLKDLELEEFISIEDNNIRFIRR